MQSTQYFFFKLSRRLDILDKPEFASLLMLNTLEFRKCSSIVCSNQL